MRKELIEFRGERSQKEMGDMFKVSQQTWSCWESGKVTPPVKKMAEVAKASGNSVENLFPDVFN